MKNNSSLHGNIHRLLAGFFSFLLLFISIAPALADDETFEGDSLPSGGDTYIDYGTRKIASTPKIDNTQFINSSGAVTSSVPIQLNPYRHQFELNLALQYNSLNSSQTSPYGYGWELPLAEIHRKKSLGVNTMYQTNEYEFELFGDRGELVPLSIDPQTGYGEYGIKETGSFPRITRDASGWIWETTDGIRFEFQEIRYRTSTTQIYSWRVTTILDKDGNTITLQYSGGNNPSSIHFNPQTSGNTEQVLSFTWESKPDTVIDASYGYFHQQTERLKKLQLHIGSSLVREYDLSYSTGANGKRSLLSSVQETGWNGTSSKSFLPYTFEYTPSNISFVDEAANYSIPGINYTYGSSYKGMKFIDFNHDHFDDLVSPSVQYLQGMGRDWLNNKNGTFTSLGYFYPSLNTAQGYDNELLLLLDLTGDGRDDFWSFSPSSWGAVTVTPAMPYPNFNFDYTSSSTMYFSQTIPGFFPRNSLLGDIDGDGDIDSVSSIETASIRKDSVLLNQGGLVNWIKDTSWSIPIPFFRTAPSSPEDLGVRSLDINSDGLVDLVQAGNGSSLPSQYQNKVMINSGQKTWDPIYSWTGGEFINMTTETAMYLMDFNADGLVDILKGVWTNTIEIKFGRGDGSFLAQTFTLPLHGPLVLGDLNGDGLMDIVMITQDGSTIYRHVYINKGQQPDLLKKVTLPSKGTLEFEYESSTRTKRPDGQFSNHNLPFVIPVLSKSIQNDGMGNQLVSEYRYDNGWYHFNG
ncbi:MAG: FG-GAP-like repeat-containing protein, partial [Candidatus Gracilibacteria bacterium]|nr:FG-GAP-like repeat-containing protein [Candidatus Gracilibacteria bacterium]